MPLVKSIDHYFDEPIWVPRRKARNWFVYFSAFVLRPTFKSWFRYKVHGKRHIPADDDGAVVFAANHVSYQDPLIMWSLLYSHVHGSRFLAKDTLFDNPIGKLLARAGAISVEPDSADRKAVKRAAAALKRGEHVLIFPEGTRMNDPAKEYHPHAGLVLIASMGKAKIVPVGIQGTDRIWPRGQRLPRFPKVYVKFGEAIDIKGEQFADLPKKERTQIILDTVMERVFELRDTAHVPDEGDG